MRPDKRPERPYTDLEILDRVEQHFVTEGNPRCTFSASSSCCYSKTGCAVGCLMTSEDAESLDRHGSMGVARVKNYHREIWNVYFKDDQEELLMVLQRAHDRSDPQYLKPHIAAVIADERRQRRPV